MNKICSVPDCGKPVAHMGMCHTHHNRWYRTGSVNLTRQSAEKRFWLKVKKTDTCWLWTGSVTNAGYGKFYIMKSHMRFYVSVHRYVYELLKCKIPDGMVIDHLCYNRLCVNPDHMEVVTQQENLLRGKALITQCPYGHPYSPENTYINKRGARSCKQCTREASRELWRRKHPNAPRRIIRFP